MPDPTAHADDMKSLAVIEPNTSPAFWWVNPWGYALSMKRALDAVYLLSETTEDAYKAATTVIKQKDELVDCHRNNLNTFQRKVELTLKPVFGNGGYEDTLDLVSFAADEIKALRAERAGLLHETKVAVANNEVNEGNIDNLEAKLESKQSFINQALKDLEICQDRIAELEGKKKPKAKRKPAKKKAQYGDLRDSYAALGREVLKGLAKKKGVRRA